MFCCDDQLYLEKSWLKTGLVGLFALNTDFSLPEMNVGDVLGSETVLQNWWVNLFLLLKNFGRGELVKNNCSQVLFSILQ